jgi:predicted membrane GTPase involved in stress response
MICGKTSRVEAAAAAEPTGLVVRTTLPTVAGVRNLEISKTTKMKQEMKRTQEPRRIQRLRQTILLLCNQGKLSGDQGEKLSASGVTKVLQATLDTLHLLRNLHTCVTKPNRFPLTNMEPTTAKASGWGMMRSSQRRHEHKTCGT